MKILKMSIVNGNSQKEKETFLLPAFVTLINFCCVAHLYNNKTIEPKGNIKVLHLLSFVNGPLSSSCQPFLYFQLDLDT